MHLVHFFFQAEDGIRDLVRSRGLGDVYKRQLEERLEAVVEGDGLRALAGEGEIAQLRDLGGEELSLIHI